ncbi:MAG: RNA polymerase factor sigma-54, partial [Methyloprofundus sp.]
LELLANNDRQKLIRKLAVTSEQLSNVIAIVRSLDPKPGAILNTTLSDYVVPDVYVVRLGKGKWQVELNPDVAPKIRVNTLYSGMVKRADETTDNVSMRSQLQEARWFIKSLHSRNDTILRVAKAIVEKQIGFLENGPLAMKPMILKDIAEELDLHESTISRVTTQKFMHTRSGVFEFKYFFSSHVSTVGGGECSAIAIRSLIKELVESENSQKPLSDSNIAAILNDKGINVARRTIAKYREGMAIPSSSHRKRFS